MKNKAYYFSHDGNAHNDVKIQYMTADLGMEGYGIYWYLIETLFEAGGYLPMNMIKILAKKMDTTEPKVRVVVEKYGLFQIIDNEFFSERLLLHFNTIEKLSVSGKKGARMRWNGEANREAIGEANGEAKDTLIARKEKKVKEKKLKEIIIKGGLYTSEQFNELPEQYIQSSIEQLKIQKDTSVTALQIQKMWDIFKAQNLNGDKYYSSESDVYRHFSNWVKNQKFEKHGTKQISQDSNDKFNQSIEYLNRYSKG